MSVKDGRVKARTYDSSARRARARESQERVLRAAEERFLRDGYAATTVAEIARDSDVSVETIYKTFGGKTGLVRAMQQEALGGSQPVPAPVRSDAMSDRERDPDVVLRRWADFTEELSPRGAPIMLLVRAAAATDSAMADLLAELNQQRLHRMAHNARRLAAIGGLRPGLAVGQIRDVLFAVTAAELYEVLVIHRGWTHRAYSDFIYRTMRAQLLP